MDLQFLGQSGFLLVDGSRRVLFDPFLGDLEDPRERAAFPRLVPPPTTPQDLGDIDVVLISHHHGDHLHRATLHQIAKRSPDCAFVVSTTSRDMLQQDRFPMDRVHVAQLPTWMMVNDVRIHPVPARHYEFSDRPDVMFDYFGYVVEIAGRRVYHAGDTIPFNGLFDLVASLQVDVALLPINGRDEAREREGIVGNLNENESASFVLRAGFPNVVPCHTGMFAQNTSDPERFVALLRERCYPGVVWVPVCGHSWTF